MALAPELRAFVDVLIETGVVSRAESASGVSAHMALHNPAVVRAARDALQAQLLRIAPKALGVLESLMNDVQVPSAVRRLAASDILDRVGLVSQAALQLAKPIDNISEMPARDLRALVSRLETELFARATPVRDLELVASEDPSNTAKPLTILD